MNPTLSYTEGVYLDIASQSWRYSGERDQAIKDRLNITSAAFFTRLNAMLDDPDIEAAEPVIVHRLQRLRDQRSRSRARVSSRQ